MKNPRFQSIIRLNLVTAIFLMGCSRNNNKETLFDALPASETNIHFANQVVDQEEFNIFGYRNFYNGGGVAIGDVNNDGLADIFLVSNMGDNKLYLNRGEFKFEDITSQAGVAGAKAWSTGVTFADVNGDGFLDIYVCNSGNQEKDDRSNELFINQQNGTFKDEAAAYGLDDKGFSTHAAFFDYDKDGDLDMYLLNNSFIPVGQLNYRNFRHERDKLGGHKLFRNDGTKFSDVSATAGIYGSIIGFGLGVTVGDVNDDNWLDIYVSNDFYERDYLYINNQNGTFTERVKEQMGHLSLSSMGADIADINNDGTLDIFVTDMLPGNDVHLKQTFSFESYDLYMKKVDLDYHHQIMQNMLQLNNGDGTFSEVARMARVEATDWSWGALIFDMDNDGRKDIFVANGILRDLTDQDFLRYLADKNRIDQIANGKKFEYKEFLKQMPSRPVSNYAFRNLSDTKFENNAKAWGLEGPGFSNGAAYGDLDNDGDLDLVVNNVNSKASVYKNKSIETKNVHYLRVKLKGEEKNRQGIGTKIKVYRTGEFQYLQQMPNRGFQSSMDHVLIFGLGSNASPVDSVEVLWPDDKTLTLRNVQLDRELVVDHREAKQSLQYVAKEYKKIFENVTEASGLRYEHTENEYVDFYRDPLLKQMLSTEGPAMAVGDINGDNLQDVFFGASKGERLALFIQKKNGGFQRTSDPVVPEDSAMEVVAMSIADVDNDKDLDLLLVTGSNEYSVNDAQLFDRLYLNNGKGRFSKSDGIPALAANGSCIASSDFDNDGDIDFFVGARSVPGRYGELPASHLYINTGSGEFKNYTKRYLPTAELGMVTDAVWADIDDDNYEDLIIVGDWMPVKIFRNDAGKRLVPIENGLNKTSGWWNCIKPADIDGDGDIDFILGNAGTNSRIRADSLHPATLYTNDFDNNGAVEQVISCVSEDGNSYPMVLKHDLEKQLPFIKKRFVTYATYAGKTIDEIFTPQELGGAIIHQVFTANSSILYNDGEWTFRLEGLPSFAQKSPVFAIESIDFDHDGRLDILMGGNFFEVLPELGRYDASYGLAIRNVGPNLFEEIVPKRSGFFLKGQVRDLAPVNINGKRYIIALRNSDSVQLFQLAR